MTDGTRAPIPGPIFADILEARLTRRRALAGLGGAAAAGLGGATVGGRVARAASPSTLTFVEPDHVIGKGDVVAPGHDARVLIRWGDAVLADAPPFDAHDLRAADQARQFGYNNDFLAFMPLPRGSAAADRGLLCVNHEYTSPALMWPERDGDGALAAMTRDQVDYEMQAHGHTVIEVVRENGGWTARPGSAYARRITATTPMALSGPAAGHPRLRTTVDPEGRRVLGTINNCAGGTTPWGTVLIAEENFHMYFSGDPAGTPEAGNHGAYGIKGKPRHAWGRFDPRFDVAREPNEPNRFGWIVEFDPYDPDSVPVKRTALGRFKHEGASTWLDPSGRVVVYSGDDEAFQYLYRFVSDGRVDPGDPAAGRDLLDRGTLSVARFDADGTVAWLPLVHGQGPLTAANGFASQADVLIETRRAATLRGATPLDRPEDVDVNPKSGRAYLMLTNNKARKPEDVDFANPRGPNPHGHIVELIPPGRTPGLNHLADRFRWEVLLLAGDPSNRDHGARYHPATSDRGWFAAPDNGAFDPAGRLWIATDQGSAQAKNNIPDGVYACDVDGDGRALTRFFYACPEGAELCGPAFTPDGRTLFVAVQHPGEIKGSSFATPATRWPADGDSDMPPRPSVVAITRKDGGVIGG